MIFTLGLQVLRVEYHSFITLNILPLTSEVRTTETPTPLRTHRGLFTEGWVETGSLPFPAVLGEVRPPEALEVGPTGSWVGGERASSCGREAQTAGEGPEAIGCV